MIRCYQWWLDAEVYAFLKQLPRGRRGMLERSLDRLASVPFAEPDFISVDAGGEAVFHRFVRDWVIVYHVDHAVRRIFVFEIYRTE